MSAFGHIALGAAAARLTTPSDVAFWRFAGRAAVLCGLALLPDADIVVSRFRTSADSHIAHRAAFHSVAFAGASGFVAAALAPSGRRRGQGMLVALVVGSHGVLDAFGHTTNGVALLWPVSRRRFLGPWHVFPSPPANRELLSRRGLGLLCAELLVFAPLCALAARPRHGRRSMLTTFESKSGW
jgi:membrane-bound metal-dependent hydrolase YbcI (DUF457 family)